MKIQRRHNHMKNSILISIALILFAGCIKHQATINENIILEDQLRFSSPQIFLVDNSSDTTIQLKSGSSWYIKQATFKDSSNQIIVGAVELTIFEYDNLVECILEGISTSSNKGLLQTDGMFYFKATQNETNVLLNKPISVEYKAIFNRLKSPSLFKGKNETRTIVWSEDTASVYKKELALIRWTQSDTFYIYSDGTMTNIRTNDNFYTFELSFIGWTNVDESIPTSDNTLYVSTNEKIHNAQYYLLFEGSTALMRGYINNEGDSAKFENLPILKNDNPAYLVIFTLNKDDSITYFLTAIDILTEKTIEVKANEFSSVSLAEFKVQMEKLWNEKILTTEI